MQSAIPQTPGAGCSHERDTSQDIELAKSSRPPEEKEKGKGAQGKKGTEESKETPIPIDFHDSSVHNLELRASILSGYEQFKVCIDPLDVITSQSSHIS
jgi:hypothetical protein